MSLENANMLVSGDVTIVGDMTVTDAHGTRVIPAPVSNSSSGPWNVDASRAAAGQAAVDYPISTGLSNVAWGYSEPRHDATRSNVDRGSATLREFTSRDVISGMIGPEPAPAAPATSTAGGESRTSHVRRADPASIHAFVEFMQRIWPGETIRIRGSTIERAGIRYVPDRSADRIHVYTATIADRKFSVVINFRIKDEIERSMRENSSIIYSEKYVRGVIDQKFTKEGAKSTNLVYEDGQLVSRTIIDGDSCTIETWGAPCSCGSPHPESSTTILGDKRRVRTFAPPEIANTYGGIRVDGELLLSDYSYSCADRFMTEASWAKDGACIDYGTSETLEEIYEAGVLKIEIRKYISKGQIKVRKTEHSKHP